MPSPSRTTPGWRHRVTRRAANAGLAIAAVVAVGLAVAITVLRVGFAPVLSNSMAPAYEAGDVVITMPRDVGDVKVGDVAILPFPDDSGARYAHRIVELTPSGNGVLVRTKGDDNPAVDEWQLEITSESVPVVVAAIPHLGWTSNLVRSRAPRLALAVVVAIAALVGIGRARSRRSGGPAGT